MTTITQEKIDHLRKVHATRRTWQTADNTSTNKVEACETVRRILSIRRLELDIADSVQKAIDSGVIPAELSLCYDQILVDEEKHDYVLNQAASRYSNDAQTNEKLILRFKEFVEDPTIDNLVLNYVTECMLFINLLPFLQRKGDSFTNTVASWILLDEARHIVFGRVYTSATKKPIPVEIIRWCVDVIKWCLKFEDGETIDATCRRAFKCLESGVPNDDQQVIPQSPRFFENKETPHYV